MVCELKSFFGSFLHAQQIVILLSPQGVRGPVWPRYRVTFLISPWRMLLAAAVVASEVEILFSTIARGASKHLGSCRHVVDVCNVAFGTAVDVEIVYVRRLNEACFPNNCQSESLV